MEFLSSVDSIFNAKHSDLNQVLNNCAKLGHPEAQIPNLELIPNIKHLPQNHVLRQRDRSKTFCVYGRTYISVQIA